MYMLDGGAPFRRDAASGAVYDAAGQQVKLLGDTMKIIAQIATDPEWADCQIAYVSRTEYPEWAIPCLQQFPIPGHPRGLTLFDVSMHNEIYPGSKLTHFKQIHKRSGLAYEDM
jgi:magnesium-dependent phosphatase 1